MSIEWCKTPLSWMWRQPEAYDLISRMSDVWYMMCMNDHRLGCLQGQHHIGSAAAGLGESCRCPLVYHACGTEGAYRACCTRSASANDWETLLDTSSSGVTTVFEYDGEGVHDWYHGMHPTIHEPFHYLAEGNFKRPWYGRYHDHNHECPSTALLVQQAW